MKRVKGKLKNVTMERLASMVQRGFLDVNKRFDTLEKEMDFRFGEVENRLDRIEKILFLEYKERVEKLEDQVRDLQSDFRQLVGLRK